MVEPGPKNKGVALISHDRKKDGMVSFCVRHRDRLQHYPLVATGTTGGRIIDATGLSVKRMLSGPLGGDAQISSLIAEGKILAVFFFIDGLYAQPHEPDIRSLMRLCDVHNVAMATNLATAEMIIDNLGHTKKAESTH